jgi:ubiquinone/menaquinone biosynthesis C-methylase UbiE
MKILDVGCGEGTMVRLLEESGSVVYGIDINADAVRTARHPRIAQASAVELPFADGSFDLCVGSHVIEHLESPRDFLSELARVVTSNGRVVLIYPWEPIQGITIVPDVLFSGKWPRRALLHRIHRHRVNPVRLSRFTKGTGLRHEQSRMFLGLPHLSFQYLTVLAKRR